jgi:hypothetical protein
MPKLGKRGNFAKVSPLCGSKHCIAWQDFNCAGTAVGRGLDFEAAPQNDGITRGGRSLNARQGAFRKRYYAIKSYILKGFYYPAGFLDNFPISAYENLSGN